MEQHFNASVEKVFGLLTDPKWLEARSLALGELSASVKAKRTAGGVVITMNRRVRRDLPGLVAKVMSPESDLHFEETWAPASDGRRTGSLTMDAIGQPVKMTAEFELETAAKGCVYRITHQCKSTVPLVGGAVAKFVLGQVEQGCTDELTYLAAYLKKNK